MKEDMSESNYSGSESSEEETTVLKPVEETSSISDVKDVETTQMTHPESEEDSDEESDGETEVAQLKEPESSAEQPEESAVPDAEQEKESEEAVPEVESSHAQVDEAEEKITLDHPAKAEHEDKEDEDEKEQEPEVKAQSEPEISDEPEPAVEDVEPTPLSTDGIVPGSETVDEPEPEEKTETPVNTAAIKASFSQGSAAPSQGSATTDRFREPVLKEKIKNPVLLENAGQKHGAGIDKFHEPVLKIKIKNPSSFVGQKHSAGADSFESKVALEKGLKNPTFGYLKSSFTGHSKFTEPIAVSSGRTDSLKRSEWGKGGPNGNFKWVQVGGSWKKQYDA